MRRLGEAGLRTVLSWLVVVLLVVPVGGALWLGVAVGESPCILCWAQRTSMILIALVALFVVRYGPRPRYLGVLILLGAWGIWMATRHSSLHLARDIGQGFAIEILGAHTYTWAWVIHWIVLIAAGTLLLLTRGPLEGGSPREPGRVGRFAMGLFVVLVGANAVQAFVSTGPPPFLGQGDPVRLSLNPDHWVWSTAEYDGAIGWRGSWAVEAPDPTARAADADLATAPLADLPELAVARWEEVAAPLDGAITGLAVAPAPAAVAGNTAAEAESTTSAAPRSTLLTTEDFGVYVLDDTLSRVLHRVVIDPGFSIDVRPLAGAAFLGPDTLAIVTVNKSYLLLQPDPNADPVREWRHFLETDGGMTELRRSRFTTVRARLQYASSLAYDPVAEELITVSVPSEKHPNWVVSRFDRSDFVLSSEFVPQLGPGLEPSGPERGLTEYAVTGAAVADGRLYAVSAAYSTVLVIDLDTETVTAAFAVPGLEAPVGLALWGEELWIAQADGRVAVVARPAS
ncbi:MAG: disulfide bond formation protein B [Candidatus Longimicrobiales bacterium M2_2A_002]